MGRYATIQHFEGHKFIGDKSYQESSFWWYFKNRDVIFMITKPKIIFFVLRNIRIVCGVQIFTYFFWDVSRQSLKIEILGPTLLPLLNEGLKTTNHFPLSDRVDKKVRSSILVSLLLKNYDVFFVEKWHFNLISYHLLLLYELANMFVMNFILTQ